MNEPADQEKSIATEPNRALRRSTAMRLAISGLILLVTLIDFKFGQPGTPLHIASLAAGILLAGTVLADYLWFGRLAAETEVRRRKREQRQQPPLRASGADQ
jgi:archaellum biogenesis protein FlaJ (TadC family)